MKMQFLNIGVLLAFSLAAKSQVAQMGTIVKMDSLKIGVPILEKDGPSISSVYGMRFHPILKRLKMHNGVDIKIKGGTNVLSIASGTVVATGYESTGLGYYVKIAHGMGLESIYGHLFCFFVKVGDKVGFEEVIGLVGRSGMATGNHLHFIIKKEGVAVDPLPYFYNVLLFFPTQPNDLLDNR